MKAQGMIGSSEFYFAGNPLLENLEHAAKSQGLEFIDELIFENGAVYRGKFDSNPFLPLCFCCPSCLG